MTVDVVGGDVAGGQDRGGASHRSQVWAGAGLWAPMANYVAAGNS